MSTQMGHYWNKWAIKIVLKMVHEHIAQSDPCHLINPSTIYAKSTDNKGWVSTELNFL